MKAAPAEFSADRARVRQSDISNHLHSYTNAREHEASGPLTFVEGEGIYVIDENGRKFIDGMAGLWSASLGFSNRRLADAAYRQLLRLPYSHTFGHRTTDAVVELAERLKALAPVPMSRVFFACSGSEANETAVKIVWYVNNALGRPQKRKIISRVNGYHGVTIAAASMTGLPNNHRSFGLPLPEFKHTLCPHHYRNAQDGESEEQFATRCAHELEAMILREGADTVAAMICEPVMGAGGVIVPPRTYYQKIQQVCRRFGLIFIADEAICGFGRTGNAWGSQTLDIKPDIVTCAKALSASFMPISAVMINEEIYDVLASESEKLGVWSHGFTYSGHPVAAAVALETLKIYEETKLFATARETGQIFQRHLQSLADHPLVGEVMGVGLMGALELVADKKSRRQFDPVKDRAGARLAGHAKDGGLLVRNVGDRLVLAPPLVISEGELAQMFASLRAALERTTQDLAREALA